MRGARRRPSPREADRSRDTLRHVEVDTHAVQLVDLDGQSADSKWTSTDGMLPTVDEVIEVGDDGAHARVTDITPDDATPIRAQLLDD